MHTKKAHILIYNWLDFYRGNIPVYWHPEALPVCDSHYPAMGVIVILTSTSLIKVES